MAGNTIGQAFAVTTFGESHGPAVGCVVDGCPAGVPLSAAQIGVWLQRRRPGQSALTSARAESDQPQILSGVFEGLTLGTPIAVLVPNIDAKAKDYDSWRGQFRPGHADFTWATRYGHRDHRGGGRASARETVGRVAAGAIAEALLHAMMDAKQLPRIEIVAWTQQIATIVADSPDPALMCEAQEISAAAHAIAPLRLTRAQVDANAVRCPDADAAAQMLDAIEQAQLARDSVGGIVRCIVRNVPAGWGDPVFDKLSGSLAHALMSLPAVKGLQFGSGFSAVALPGSAHNDAFVRAQDGRIATQTNHAGGLLGGLSTGEPLVLDVAFKPASSIPQPQQAISADGPAQPLTVTGRHDPCVVPRAVVLVEAAVALVLADHALRHSQLQR